MVSVCECVRVCAHVSDTQRRGCGPQQRLTGSGHRSFQGRLPKLSSAHPPASAQIRRAVVTWTLCREEG